MKSILTAIALLGVSGCLPQLPKVPEIPSVEIPEVEVPTTILKVPENSFQSFSSFSKKSGSDTEFITTCIAGFVETSPGVGTIYIAKPSMRSFEIESISNVKVSVVPEFKLDPC